MAFTYTWNAAFEALPADADNVSDGATKIRNLKNAIRERLAIDHYFDVAGTDADHGEHKKISFHAQEAKPTATANKGFLYTKDVSAKAELHWLDEGDNELILSRLGFYNALAGFHTGTYAITFPTNGLATAKIMIGDSNTIAWFYNNAAPPGWKIALTGDYGIRVGSTGGATAGSWTISGISHSHTGTTDDDHTLGTSDTTVGSGAYAQLYEHTHPFTTAVNGNGNVGDGSWRYAAYVGKLCQLDTA